MSKFDRSSLLKFLRKPRCLRDIVRQFEVPTQFADHRLQEAIKSGEVVVFEKQTPPRFLNSNAKQLRLKGLHYISRNSPLLAKDLAAKNSLPKTRSSAAKEPVYHNRESLVFSKMKLGSNRSSRRLRWKTQYASSESKSLSYVEKIRLFQTLSNQPLPFSDIHRRFSISKQIVEGFVKRGIFEEMWGPKNIGVKFKLTEKGEAYLKTLEKASNFEHQQRKKIFIRLKHRIPF